MQYSILSIDPERVASLLGVVTLFSFLIERALAVVFESRAINEWLSRRSLKEPIAVLVSLGVCWHWNVDVITALVSDRTPDFWGQLITAAIIAGGSKASIKLFHDWLDTMSNAERERQAPTKLRGTTKPPHALPAGPLNPSTGLEIDPEPEPKNEGAPCNRGSFACSWSQGR